MATSAPSPLCSQQRTVYQLVKSRYGNTFRLTTRNDCLEKSCKSQKESSLNKKVRKKDGYSCNLITKTCLFHLRY